MYTEPKIVIPGPPCKHAGSVGDMSDASPWIISKKVQSGNFNFLDQIPVSLKKNIQELSHKTLATYCLYVKN